jgi:plastocyanin
MRTRIAPGLFVVCLGLLLHGADPGAAQISPVPNSFTGLQNSRKPIIHTVTIDGTRFSPEELTVNSGDTIVWVNKDLIPHTATSKVGGFDSQTIATGKSWKYAAKKKGNFPYICTFHPTMKGTLRVK